MSETLIRILALCVALAAAETLHGIVRAAVLVPRIGKKPALKVSIVTGSILAFILCYALVPAIGLEGNAQLLGLGVLLSGFMAAFDIVLARLVMKLKWERIFAEFNPLGGNYLSVGLLLLVFYPWIVMHL